MELYTNAFIPSILKGKEVEKYMNVIMYYPDSEEAKRELSRRVAVVHAQSVVQKVKSLSCPLEQKIALLEAVKQHILDRDSR